MISSFPAVDFIQQTFAINGKLLSVEPFGQGNVHDSFRLTCDPTVDVSYLLQRLNQQIFPGTDQLMENIDRLTRHLRDGLRGRGITDASRRYLELISTRDGRTHARNEFGDVYRVFRFIENSISYRTVEGPEQAFLAARAIGDFQSVLSTLKPNDIAVSIPDFHNTRKRLVDLRIRAIEDSAGRTGVAKAEIEFAFAREALAGRLLILTETGVVPDRLAHNDAKLDNVLFCRATGEVLCVCDLDTVMPGLSLYDFGDLVRSCASHGTEDQGAEISLSLFEALAEGYLDGTRGLLTEVEVEHLALAGQLISFETGVRFLTDYLSGDTYFKIDYPEHNLNRCRTQFALVSSIERRFKEMSRIVEKVFRGD